MLADIITYSQKGKMTILKMKGTDEKFRKRKNNILKNGDELRLLCGANVYILLHRKGKYYTYKTNRSSFLVSAFGKDP